MFNYQLSLLAKITEGKLIGEDKLIDAITIDSRQSIESKRGLFIPIIGEHFDGHEFINDAFSNGSIATLTEKNLQLDYPQILVGNTREALGKIAALHRTKFKAPVIGLTGSLGKTTTKAFIANIFQQSNTVLAPSASMNNDIGVPLTLFQLANQDYAVIEMGTNHPGEINYLANIVQPDVALITVIGKAHLEALKTLDGVAKEKREIFSGLKPNGIAVVNKDDPYSKQFEEVIGDRKVIFFGLDKSADVRAERITVNDDGTASFQLITPQFETDVKLTTLGKHNVFNALAAAAVAQVYNLSPEDIKAGLQSNFTVSGRLVQRSGLNGSLIIDDSYSAIPEAVAAAIDVLTLQKGKKIFVFGGMAELVHDSIADLHQKIGSMAAEKGVDELLLFGDRAALAAEAFPDAKLFASKTDLIDYIKPKLAQNVSVLIKGARGQRLETVVSELTKI